MRVLLAVGLLLAACKNRPACENEPLELRAPAALGAGVVPHPARNPFTEAGIALGRRLFHDPRLSGKATSCASCHLQAKAFADGRQRSTGTSGRPLLRHTPVLINLAWHRGYFWDGGASDLESQAFAPLDHEDEMGTNLRAMMARLAEDPALRAEFACAFGEEEPAIPSFARALAQFERTLISADSRFDRGALDPVEQQGLAVFQRECARCHPLPFFTDHDYHSVSLPEAFSEENDRLSWGRARISNEKEDLGAYKTPTLRNVAVSAPYMHDGRFATLHDVLQHYARNDVAGTRLEEQELDPLLAFLRALTDETFLENPAFGPR